ncbi:hypothetical protein GCM10010195_73950 [Kitasatospora griseola]|nr:hypothetical protein GCM10010195_73950 [Kitasatospora griseola]
MARGWMLPWQYDAPVHGEQLPGRGRALRTVWGPPPRVRGAALRRPGGHDGVGTIPADTGSSCPSRLVQVGGARSYVPVEPSLVWGQAGVGQRGPVSGAPNHVHCS